MTSIDSTTEAPPLSCSKCGEKYPHTVEYFRPSSPGKPSRVCNVCRAASKSDWFKNNREKAYECSRQSYARHRQEVIVRRKEKADANRNTIREQRRHYYYKNHARLRQQNKLWREANSEALRQYYKLWRERNHERTREIKAKAKLKYRASEKGKLAERRYRIENKDKQVAYARQWRRENPEKVRARWNKRRARKANGAHTAEDIAVIYKSQNGKCWHCGKSVGDNYHVDHLIPLARGGSNDARNLVISCPECNLSKGAKLPHEWSDRLL